jgi:hypothetical protein
VCACRSTFDELAAAKKAGRDIYVVKLLRRVSEMGVEAILGTLQVPMLIPAYSVVWIEDLAVCRPCTLSYLFDPPGPLLAKSRLIKTDSDVL